jgi:hypothetical protein
MSRARGVHDAAREVVARFRARATQCRMTRAREGRALRRAREGRARCRAREEGARCRAREGGACCRAREVVQDVARSGLWALAPGPGFVPGSRGTCSSAEKRRPA